MSLGWPALVCYRIALTDGGKPMRAPATFCYPKSQFCFLVCRRFLTYAIFRGHCFLALHSVLKSNSRCCFLSPSVGPGALMNCGCWGCVPLALVQGAWQPQVPDVSLPKANGSMRLFIRQERERIYFPLVLMSHLSLSKSAGQT